MNAADVSINSSLVVLYGICIYGSMWALSSVLLKFGSFKNSITVRSSRYGSLDGLRGVLALSVLAYHGVVMYIYFTKGVWESVASPILNHLGETSVAMFFMITSFLFTNKAFQSQVRWKALYLSRVYRLTPLYLIIVVILFGLVFWQSDFQLKESPLRILKEFALWCSFCCFGRPDINAYPTTWRMIAGVNWTLRLEILFYVIAIPMLHVVSRIVSVRTALILMVGVMGLILSYRSYAGPVWMTVWLLTLYASHFAGGIVVALALNQPTLKSWIAGRLFRLLAVGAIGPFFFLKHSDSSVAVLSATVIFAAVAGGASLFGILNTRNAIWLGDVSYGIYLIHGVVLWLAMTFLKSHNQLENLRFIPFLLTIIFVASLVVVLASLSYSRLEKPVMSRLSSKRNEVIR
jgi:peptidoglycan/LPS O-acetylase OafA/YrhL